MRSKHMGALPGVLLRFCKHFGLTLQQAGLAGAIFFAKFCAGISPLCIEVRWFWAAAMVQCTLSALISRVQILSRHNLF